MDATEMKAEQELDIRIKGRKKEKVFVMHFFCSGIAQNVYFYFIFMSDRQSDGGKCVGESGHEW